MPKSRLWAFTNFDPVFNYEQYLSTSSAEYLAYGLETCPKTKKQHAQGFVYFSAPRGSVKQVAKELGRCHVEMCKGTLDQNSDYCSKEGDLVELGVKPKQGKRVDLEKHAEAIRLGKRKAEEIYVEHPAVLHQYGRTLDRLEDIALRKRFRTEMTVGLWIWGPTGVGKSHAVFQGFDPDTHYVHNLNDNGWWDGYTGQKIVIFNEFRGQVTFSELLDLADKWPKTVKRRGRQPVPFIAERIVVTSSSPPEAVYANACDNHERMEQLKRRFEVTNIMERAD
jgi:hypothetical protein